MLAPCSGCCGGLSPGFYDDLGLRVTLYSLLAAGYSGLSVFELWRNRKRLEVACLPALILTLAHTGFYLVHSFADHGVSLEHAISGSGRGTTFFAFMLFESMLYAIGIAYVTLAMVRERAELKFKAAAYSDPLTGIGNRRAFLFRGEQLLSECGRLGLGLPSELAQRRPDIRQSEAALHKATAAIGVAKADFYPRISLGARVGFVAWKVRTWAAGVRANGLTGPACTCPFSRAAV